MTRQPSPIRAVITAILCMFVASAVIAACSGLSKQIVADAETCAKEQVATVANDILVDVEAILMNNATTWRDELDALKSQGTHIGEAALLCAVQRAFADLQSRIPLGAGSGQVNPSPEQIGAENARAYLATNKQSLGVTP